jgi:hypothetical protein
VPLARSFFNKGSETVVSSLTSHLVVKVIAPPVAVPIILSITLPSSFCAMIDDAVVSSTVLLVSISFQMVTLIADLVSVALV